MNLLRCFPFSSLYLWHYLIGGPPFKTFIMLELDINNRRSNRLSVKEKKKQQQLLPIRYDAGPLQAEVQEIKEIDQIPVRLARQKIQNYALQEGAEEVEAPQVEEKRRIFKPTIDQLLYRRVEQEKVEYLVKYRDRSYLHTEWMSEAEILSERNGKQKLNRFNKVFEKRVIDIEEERYFDASFSEVDRILSCTDIFPIIHPKKAGEIKGKWSESLTIVMQHLLNFTKNGVHYGVHLLNLSLTLDLNTINNRVYLGFYKNHSEFWNDLGSLFKQIQDSFDEDDEIRIIGDTLRECAIYLYEIWYENQAVLFEERSNNTRYQKESQFQQQMDQEHKQKLVPELKKEKVHLMIQDVLNIIETKQYNLIQDFEQIQEIIQTKLNITLTDNLVILEEYLKEKMNEIEIDVDEEINIEMADFQKTMGQQSDIMQWDPQVKSYQWAGEDIMNDYQYLKAKDKQQLIDPVDQIYFIKWKHLSYLESTWEPESLLDCQQKIQEFKTFNRCLDKDTRNHMIGQNQKHLTLVEFEQGLRKKKLSAQQVQELRNQLYYMNQQKEIHEYTPLTQTIYKDRKLLRDYQLHSLNWLIRAFHDDRNVILADEMGLGKTIQTIAFLNHLYIIEGYRGPFLVIAPLSTLEHWKRTVEDWTNLNGLLYYDQEGSSGRQICRNFEWYYTDISKQGLMLQANEIYKYQVLITSYEVFLLDFQNILINVPFQFIVIDEAHKLKNQNARILQALKKMPCKRNLLLTGTPIQNNTEELFSLLNFIEPHHFPNQKQFLKEYGSLETSEQVDKLNILLRPYILRRQKEDVEQDIPPLQETIIDIEMTTIQKTIYKALYEKNKSMLEQGFSQFAANATQLNNLEIQLRKCCNHPFLIHEMQNEISKNCKDFSEYIVKLIESSGKMILLDKLLNKFRGEGKKMLIFSQFTMMLSILEEYLKYKSVKYEKIDGQIKARERQNAIDRFNDPTKLREVFLLSTKAGGQGINLTAAEIVVIYDSDWNPQNDVQATARAHRIGQSKEVTVYRLVTKDTYESEMFERAIKKLGLDQAIFMGGQFKQHEKQLIKTDKKFSKQEMEVLLKNGIIGLITNDNEDFYEQNIDEILKKNSRMAKYSLVNGSYTVSKQSFISEKTDKNLSLSDPNFWKIILKNQESKAQKLLKGYDGAMCLLEQKKYMEEVGDSVNQIIESKLNQVNYNADDERQLLELLNRINISNFAKNYRELAMTWIYELGKPSRRIKRVLDVQKPTRVNELQGEDARRLALKSKDELIKKLCYVCERPNCSYYCMGHCRRSFHETCKDLLETSEFVNTDGPDPQFLAKNQFPELNQDIQEINIRYQCPDCRNNLVICLLCKQKGTFYSNDKKYKDEIIQSDELEENEPTEDNIRKIKKPISQLSKCSTANCNRYFHLSCIQQNQLSKMLDSNTVLFRCPSHVCVYCKVNSSNMTTALIHCVRCCRSYHSKCAPYEAKQKMQKIGKKVMICDQCYKYREEAKLDTVVKISLKDYPKKLKQAKLDFKITGTTERTRRIEQQRLGIVDIKDSESIEKIQKKITREKRKADVHPYTYEELGIIPVKEFNYMKFKNDWCRYCGARFASNFTKGPWGSRTLCTIHYINWGQKKTLDLSEYPDLPMSPISRDDPTELQFLQRQKARDPNFDPKKELDFYNEDQYKV
ncbi:hypothetical protein pb186bvf_003702 [Paramecium bursaria]